MKKGFEESINIKNKILNDQELCGIIQEVCLTIIESYKNGGKIILCGNGGSASDALHIAGELIGRFQMERKSLPAIVLNADIATMTAIANDYGYENVFSRQVEGLMAGEDILIGISTSGNSDNVYRAIIKAKEIGGRTIGLLGGNGGKIGGVADFSIIVPSDVTARVQESHITIGHIICEIVESVISELC
ncbi:SIS domain-containing protein [Tissierella sp. DSM 105185]|uniref:Phosphoheptose isomerase n=1 Tax=Tissierella pigra TaxID=2607614 RepID=A0A6N7XEP9_9FIRM|nr:SIS domain-containing protein [Tissierella pigra]